MGNDLKQTDRKLSHETLVTHHGRRPEKQFGFVNTPVYRGSTILFGTLDELDDYGAKYRYGRNDNPTLQGLLDAITDLEEAAGTVAASSGLAAITTALLSVLERGDELLMPDTAYEPTRDFGTEFLARFGVTTRFYDPRIGAGIKALMTPRTKAIFVESPGSLTFEMQDLPAIAAAAKTQDAFVIVDNTWASPLFHKPLTLGADIVVHSGTKMLVGHSDAMYGVAAANGRALPLLKKTHRRLGVHAPPDDSYLAARGLRTLAIRMKEHEARALEMAQWFERQPAVRAVFHPALPSHPDHAIWKRDFTGSGSLFSVLLDPAPRQAVAEMVNGFELFGMGYSWGGYESLCLPIHPERVRTVVQWDRDGCMFRIHIGFEGVEDLKRDMGAALERYAAANTIRGAAE